MLPWALALLCWLLSPSPSSAGQPPAAGGQRGSSIFDRVKEPQCRPLDIPLCRDIPYSRTIFPNPFVDLDLLSLQSQTEHFKPLIRTKCSPHILFFVCSVFAPMCPDQMPQAVTSCRSVCEQVQRDCIKIFHDFDFPWPPALNCSRFPVPPALCMSPQPIAASGGPLSADTPLGLPPSPPKLPECPPDLVDLDPADPAAKCAFRCEKTTMFKKDRKEQARLWLLCWALLNSMASLFTVCSFWIDRHRFRFPERSVCFLALCALLSAVPHLLRPLVGLDSLACVQLPSGAKFLALDGHRGNALCLLSFLLVFYFSLAASCWWLVLGFTWYLSAARKWVEEEIEKRSLWLHLPCWILPGLLTAFVISGKHIDASELTGLCAVGHSDPVALLWLWLLPRLVLALMGLYLVLAGFSAMCKERSSFRRRGTDTSRLEKLLLKMGSFAALFAVPALGAALCELDRLSQLVRWHPNTTGCKALGGVFSGQCIRPEQPEPELYVLGQTLALSGGIAAGLWMFSPKTLTSWKRTLLCCWPVRTKGAEGRPPSLAPPCQRPLLCPPPPEPPPLPPPAPSSAYNNFGPPAPLSLSLCSQQQNSSQPPRQFIPLVTLPSQGHPQHNIQQFHSAEL